MKKTCDTCGGSGQISYFKGVSRFLLSCEECPACLGIGYIIEDNEEKPDHSAEMSETDKKKSNSPDND